MQLDHSQMAGSRKDPRGFVVTLSLVIFTLTWIVIIVSQTKMPSL